MKHNKAQRFSHTYAINEAAGLPAKYRGKMFAVEPAPGRVMMSEIKASARSISSIMTPALDGSTANILPRYFAGRPAASLMA